MDPSLGRVTGTLHWRSMLALFALLLIYDGALRKWFLPSLEQTVFVLKDGLLLTAFLSFFATSGRIPRAAMPGPAKLFLTAYATWVALEAANPHLPNLLVSMWGLKAHLLYASLLVFVPLAFRDLGHVFDTIERTYAWIVVPVVAVALVQVAAPSFSFINQQVRGGIEGVAYFGDAGLVRVTGTFSYISGMAAFVQITTLLGVALFLAGARSKTFLFGVAVALLAVPTTGSRAVILILVIGVALLVLAALACRFISGQYAALVACMLAGLFLISVHSQDAAWEALAQRAEQTHSDENRAVTAFTNAFQYFDAAGAVGFGSGSANLGAVVLSKGVEPFSWLPFGGQFEEESGRIVIELGIIGWALSLAMRTAFLFWSVNLALRGEAVRARATGVLTLPIVALGLHQGNGVFATPLAASYYWFCIALLGMAQYEHRLARVSRAFSAPFQRLEVQR